MKNKRVNLFQDYGSDLSNNVHPIDIQTVSRPPSTGKQTPLMNAASSLARKHAAAAMSSGKDILPNGTVFANLARSSSESGTPENSSRRPVAPRNGQIEFTRTPEGPYSAANPCVIW